MTSKKPGRANTPSTWRQPARALAPPLLILYGFAPRRERERERGKERSAERVKIERRKERVRRERETRRKVEERFISLSLFRFQLTPVADDLPALVRQIAAAGMKVGVGIKPKTSAKEAIEKIAPVIDQVRIGERERERERENGCRGREGKQR